MNGNKRKKGWLAVPSLFFVWILFLTGSVFGQYLSEFRSKDVARVAYMGDLAISEETGPLILTPGVNLWKKAVVTYQDSEMAGYVFVEVETPGFTLRDDHYTYTADGLPEDCNGTIEWSINPDLTYLLSDGNTNVYYTKVEASGKDEKNNKKLSIIQDDKVRISEDIRRTDLSTLEQAGGLGICFQAFAIQSNTLAHTASEKEDAAQAWEAVRNKQ